MPALSEEGKPDVEKGEILRAGFGFGGAEFGYSDEGAAEQGYF